MLQALAQGFKNFVGVYEDQYDEENYEQGNNYINPEDEVLNDRFRNGQWRQNTHNNNHSQNNHNSQSNQNNRNTDNVINLHPQGRYTNTVVITKPNSIDEAEQICDYLRERRSIILNLVGAEVSVSRSIVDFLSGSVYALDADFQKVSKGVFIIAPSNVEVQPIKDDLRMSRGYYPYANGSFK